MPSKIAIQILGYSCVGKSTIAKHLAQKISGIYHVGYDKQKWLLSGYNRETDRELIKTITLGLLEVVCKTGIPIQLEYFRTEIGYAACKKVLDTYGYAFYTFELTAPYEVLIERFRERVTRAKNAGTRISNTSEETFNQMHTEGYFVPSGTPTFDTTLISEEEITDTILKFLK
jgi:predicted kinase